MYIISLVHTRLGKTPIWVGLLYNCVCTSCTWDTQTDREGWKGIRSHVNPLVYLRYTWDMALITQWLATKFEKTGTLFLVHRQHSYFRACVVQISYRVSHTSTLGKSAPEIHDQDCKKKQALRIAMPWFTLVFPGPGFSFIFVPKCFISCSVKLQMNTAISKKQLQD